MNCKPGYTASTRRRAREDGAIELLTSKGEAVIVDAAALADLPKGFLHITYRGYARIEISRPSGRAALFVHRLVMGLDLADGKEVDHINGNKLDNRRANLRVVSRSHNQLNKKKAFSSNSTGFLGVRIDERKKTRKYRAEMMVNQKRIYLGCFTTPEEAHSVYMRAKEALIGEIKC